MGNSSPVFSFSSFPIITRANKKRIESPITIIVKHRHILERFTNAVHIVAIIWGISDRTISPCASEANIRTIKNIITQNSPVHPFALLNMYPAMIIRTTIITNSFPANMHFRSKGPPKIKKTIQSIRSNIFILNTCFYF